MSASALQIGELLAQAMAVHQAGDLTQAETLYRQILALHPSHADARHLLGLVHYARGDLTEAVHQIRTALDAAPQSAVFHFNLGNILRDGGDLPGALAAYREAVALRADEPDYHNNLGLAWEEAGRPEEAIACYHRALELAPGDAVLWVNLATVLQQLGEGQAARQCYQQALQIDPLHAQALNNLGGLLQAEGEVAAALACYRAALHAAPDLAEAHRNYGGLLEAGGDRAGALHHYAEALRLRPDYAEVRFLMAALQGAHTPAVAPGAYVAALFDQYADEFDAHLTGVLGYCVPAQLRAVFEAHSSASELAICDLGCGTGLAGVEFRARASRLAGVDLAPRMIEKSAARGIYDDLSVADAVTALHGQRAAWDLLVAADVFVYLGDLDAVFGAARTALKPGGYLLFSVERGGSGDYTLREAGRFAHTADYIRALAAQHGFMILAEQTAVLRRNLGVDVVGLLYLLQSR